MMSKNGNDNNIYSTSHKRKMSKGSKILITILSIFLALILAAGGAAYYIFGGLKTSDFATDPATLGITSAAEADNSQNIKNIALFGIDSRNNDNIGRSDAIMILSVDQVHNKIKMTSIARDTKVYIPGKDIYDKITNAYAYGGATMSVKTINYNFKTNISEYVTVNFNQMANVVDALGGVTLTITEDERVSANENITALGSTDTIKKSGTVKLDGTQAVGYSRIRHLDSDDVRTSRQRNVMKALFSTLESQNAIEQANSIRQILPLVTTSLSYTDIIPLAPIAFSKPATEEMELPNESLNPKGGIDPTDGVWYYTYDLDAAAAQLHTFIYEN